MANKKLRSNGVSKADAMIVKTDKEDSVRVKKSDDREPVFVRLSPRANEILRNAAKAPRTKATVIEALLENFDQIKDEDLKHKILSGQIITLPQDQGRLLELRSWAEHAFENDRYVWAGDMYQMLAKHPSSSEGLKNICNYKLSVCLIRLSYAIRKEALKDSIDKDVYELALDMLDEAIAYTKKVGDKLEGDLLFPRLVLHYNLASCHSLKAQYLVESELDPSSILVKRLRDAEEDSVGRDEAIKLREDVWKTIGETWRSNPKERKIDDEADTALYELQKIVPLTLQGEIQPDQADTESDDQYSERIWMVDSAEEDEDFIFLRSDKQKWQKKFKIWTSSALKNLKPNTEAVRALIKKLHR